MPVRNPYSEVINHRKFFKVRNRPAIYKPSLDPIKENPPCSESSSYKEYTPHDRYLDETSTSPTSTSVLLQTSEPSFLDIIPKMVGTSKSITTMTKHEMIPMVKVTSGSAMRQVFEVFTSFSNDGPK